MKPVLAAALFAAIVAALFISGCAYDGEGSNFTQRDLELQRKVAERSRGF